MTECSQHHKPVLGLCLKATCGLKSRLVCFKCILTDHQHGLHILPLQDIIHHDGICIDLVINAVTSQHWPITVQGRKL